jgi:hypothetical protein
MSLRQKTNPSGFNKDVKIWAAAHAKLRGRTFLSRGGNGKITEPQGIVAMVCGFEMEYAIATAPVIGQFPSLPTVYKVDLAVPDIRLAIEIDGNSHKSKKWKFLDRRKTEILSALGWSVLRFWNHEVYADLSRVSSEIQSTISRLKTITRTSQMECLSLTAMLSRT